MSLSSPSVPSVVDSPGVGGSPEGRQDLTLSAPNPPCPARDKLTHDLARDRERLGLTQWTLRLMDDLDPDPDCAMSVVADAQARHACIHMGPAYAGLTPENQAAVRAHEMVHIILAEVDEYVEDLHESLGPVQSATLARIYNRITERVAYHLGPILADPFV